MSKLSKSLAKYPIETYMKYNKPSKQQTSQSKAAADTLLKGKQPEDVLSDSYKGKVKRRWWHGK